MKRGKLREFIMDVLADGRSHSTKDIKEKSDDYFREVIYTKKQIADTLGHLAREDKAHRISKGLYCLKKMIQM